MQRVQRSKVFGHSGDTHEDAVLQNPFHLGSPSVVGCDSLELVLLLRRAEHLKTLAGAHEPETQTYVLKPRSTIGAVVRPGRLMCLPLFCSQAGLSPGQGFFLLFHFHVFLQGFTDKMLSLNDFTFISAKKVYKSIHAVLRSSPHSDSLRAIQWSTARLTYR